MNRHRRDKTAKILSTILCLSLLLTLLPVQAFASEEEPLPLADQLLSAGALGASSSDIGSVAEIIASLPGVESGEYRGQDGFVSQEIVIPSTAAESMAETDAASESAIGDAALAIDSAADELAASASESSEPSEPTAGAQPSGLATGGLATNESIADSSNIAEPTSPLANGGETSLLEVTPQAAQWRRLQGNDRYQTMQQIVREAHPVSTAFDWAILTTGEKLAQKL